MRKEGALSLLFFNRFYTSPEDIGNGYFPGKLLNVGNHIGIRVLAEADLITLIGLSIPAVFYLGARGAYENHSLDRRGG